MKKLICSFLILVLSLSVTASYAENNQFSVRGGITFDTTKEDIIAYEQSLGNEIVDHNDFSDNVLCCKNISFAGYEEVQVDYYFDSDGHLTSIVYQFKDYYDFNNGAPEAKKLYEVIDNGLSKYGAPIATGNEQLVIDDAAIDALDYYQLFAAYSFSGPAKVLSFAQRLHQLDDGSCIDIKNMQFTYNLGTVSYVTVLSYAFYTPEQMQSFNDLIEEKQDLINNDL